MKNIFAGIVLALACAFVWSPSIAHAAGLESPQFVYQAGISSMTTNIITVATSTVGGGSFVAAQMDTPQLANRVTVEIQNIDSSANLWCIPTSTGPAVNAGRKIAAGNSWIVSVMDKFYTQVYSTTTNTTSSVTNPSTIYCISDGAAPTKAAVTQVY